MQRHFELELAGLKTELIAMGGHAEEAVTLAVRAVMERDDDLARRVKADDAILDDYEIKIDDIAIHLLAKAPLATDLRLITVAMKISQNLERVGDEATTIARRCLELDKEAPLKVPNETPRLAAIAVGMLKSALDAFVDRLPEQARAVIPRDQEADDLNRQFHRNLLLEMQKSPENITRALHLMVISKSLERIADHATNIAEEVVYLYEAKDVRHADNLPPAP